MTARTMQNGNGARQKKDMVIPHLWSVVLAGGSGSGLAPLIREWLGEELPKQYCAFTGTRSLLQHTVDRADCLSSPDQRITVIAAHHVEVVNRQLGDRQGQIVLQPANRDTAAGLMLPLTYVRAADPNATVVIYPSDHFVYPEGDFLEAVSHAVSAVELEGDRMVVLGIRPQSRELDYGHLRVDRQLKGFGSHALWTVEHFMEKPPVHAVQALSQADWLWNTMVIVTKVKTIWQIAKQVAPSLMRLFETFQPTIGSRNEFRVLNGIYKGMPVRNFSSDILERVPDRILALDVRGVMWNDWGRPERIIKSLEQLGKTPNFPPDLVGVA